MDPRPRRILSTACVAVLALTSACSWGGSDDSANEEIGRASCRERV